MDSPKKHYRLTGKLLENRDPTFISICGLSTFCCGFEAVLIYLLASVLSSAFHFLLPPRTFHLYLSTGCSFSSNAFLPSSRDAYMCPLNSQKAPLSPKSFPSLHPSLSPLSSNGSKHMGSPEMPRHYAGLCSSLLPSFLGSSSLFYFLPSSAFSQAPAGELGAQGLPTIDDNRLGAAAEKLEQMKPRPNVNRLWQLLLLGLSCRPWKG